MSKSKKKTAEIGVEPILLIQRTMLQIFVEVWLNSRSSNLQPHGCWVRCCFGLDVALGDSLDDMEYVF